MIGVPTSRPGFVHSSGISGHEMEAGGQLRGGVTTALGARGGCGMPRGALSGFQCHGLFSGSWPWVWVRPTNGLLTAAPAVHGSCVTRWGLGVVAHFHHAVLPRNVRWSLLSRPGHSPLKGKALGQTVSDPLLHHPVTDISHVENGYCGRHKTVTTRESPPGEDQENGYCGRHKTVIA